MMILRGKNFVTFLRKTLRLIKLLEISTKPNTKVLLKDSKKENVAQRKSIQI